MSFHLKIPDSTTGLLLELLHTPPVKIGRDANSEVTSWYPKGWIESRSVSYRSFTSWEAANNHFDSLVFPQVECKLEIDAWWIWETNLSILNDHPLVFSDLTQQHSWSFASLDLQIGVSGDHTIEATPDAREESQLDINVAHWGL